MGFVVYKMALSAEVFEPVHISCIPFEAQYFSDYMSVYNGCFYAMRKALDIKPYNFLSNYEQIADKSKDIFLWIEHGQIVGSVACYGSEIDDLIVSPPYRKRGCGKQLLHWAIRHIKESHSGPIVLHVAEWNKSAISLYKKTGFEIIESKTIEL